MAFSGIYEIVHVPSGRRYIGSSIDVEQRFCQHKRLLRKGKHHSTYLQNLWAKHGESAFAFRRMWRVEPLREVLLYEEQLCLSLLTCDLNMCLTAGSNLGRKMSEAARSKMSAAKKGRKQSAEQAEKQRVRMKALWASLTEDERAAWIAAWSKPRAAGTGERISRAKKGKRRPPFSPEWREKLGAAARGRVCSDAQRKKISDKAKERWARWRAERS